MRSPENPRLPLSFALVASGAAALVYESAWARMLHRVFGVSDWAIATVLAAFFLGMGLGAAIGGRVAARIERPVRAYAALEVGVAVWALGSLAVIPGLHGVYASLGEASLTTLTVVRFALALVVLLPPTIAMGATLPLLVRRFEDGADWHRSATLFYSVNTLGAAFGAAITGFFLLPSIGVRGSIAVAAALGVLAAVIARSTADGPSVVHVGHAKPQERDESEALTPGLLLTFALGSGFLSLAGEVLFTRLLRTIIQGTSQSFAAMLVTYLVGITFGSFLARRWSASALRVFGVAQLVAGLAIVFAMDLAPWLPRLVGLARGDDDLIPHEVSILLGISVLALLPLATAVGVGLPSVVALIERAGGSRVAGRVLAANTFGGLVGSLLAGFAAVPAIGLEASLYGLVVLHAALALLALLTAARSGLADRALALLGTAVVVIALFVLRPSIALPFLLDAWSDGTRAIVEGPAGYDTSQVVFLREGRNTTVSVVDREGTLRLFNDGRPESGIGSGTPSFGPELVLLGGLGPLLAGRRDRAMVVGLGAGHSTTMLLAGGFSRVDVVELEPAVLDAARTIHRMRGVRFPLDDRRAHPIVDDARARLALAHPGTYDAIVSQPSHPWLSGASALYTREFVAEAKRALRRDGVLVLWANVFRMNVRRLRDIVATVRSEMPHVAAFLVEESSFIIVASESPIDLGERVSSRLGSTPRLRELFAGYELDTVAAVLATMELDESGAQQFASGGAVLVDDRPVLEYSLSGLPHQQSLTLDDLDRAFARIPWITHSTQATLPTHLRSTLPLHRLARLESRRVGSLRVAHAIPGLALSPSGRHLLEGGVAEMLGDVTAALRSYDASTEAEAATRADSLRAVDGSPNEALAVARARAAVPSDANALLRAAIATGRADDLAFAVEIDDRAEFDSDASYRTLARALSEGGCAAAHRAPVSDVALDPVALARLADCALERGDPATASLRREAWALSRRAAAQLWFDRGSRAATGGNHALAVRFFRRSLRLWPSHRDAAERVAESLCALDRCAEAVPLLEATIDALRFSEGQDGELRDTARRLGIHLAR